MARKKERATLFVVLPVSLSYVVCANQQYPAFPFCMNITYACRSLWRELFPPAMCGTGGCCRWFSRKATGMMISQRVHICVQSVFKLHVAAHLVVVKHVRLADGFDGGVSLPGRSYGTVRRFRWRSFHTSLPVTLTALSSMMIMSRFMASLF